MRFSRQQAVRYIGDQFQYYLLIGCIKTAALKRQRFEDSESDATKPKVLKYSRVGAYENEEG